MDNPETKATSPLVGRHVPNYSEAYRTLVESLNKEMRTNLQYYPEGEYKVDVLSPERGISDTKNSEYSLNYILSECDGEASFVMMRRGHTKTRFSEIDFEKSRTDYRAAPARIAIARIKKAQSEALRSYGHLTALDYLFPVRHVDFGEDEYQNRYDRPKDYELLATAKIENSVLVEVFREDNPYLFFAKSDIQSRVGFEDLSDIIGFENPVERVLLQESNLYREFSPACEATILFSSADQESYPIDLWNLPVLAWGAVKNQSLPGFQLGREESKPFDISRNFRWELAFLGSDDILGTAEWNDIEGIQRLAEMLQDTESLKVQQALLNPDFFRVSLYSRRWHSVFKSF